MGLEVF